MNTFLAFLGLLVCGSIVVIVVAAIYEWGYSNGKQDGRMEIITEVSEGKTVIARADAKAAERH